VVAKLHEILREASESTRQRTKKGGKARKQKGPRKRKKEKGLSFTLAGKERMYISRKKERTGKHAMRQKERRGDS